MALWYVENLKTFIDEIGFKTVSSIKLQEAEKRKYENLGEKRVIVNNYVVDGGY